MTSIPVKDVGSFFMNASKTQGSGAAKAGEFQTVWSAQTGKGVQTQVQESKVKTPQKVSKPDASDRDLVEAKRTDKLSAKSDKREERIEVQEKSQETETDEITDEELVQVLEVLGTAAYELMQQIADAFGISMNELQSTMDALGMEQMDVLKSVDLGNLLLQLGGATDSYALVTDENLYTNYRWLMNQLTNVLNENAEELDIGQEEMNQLIEQISNETVEENLQTDMPVIEVIDETKEMTNESDALNTVGGIGLNADNFESVGFENLNRNNGQETQGGEEKQNNETVNGRTVYQGNEFAVQNMRTDGFANQVQTAEAVYAMESPWDEQTLDIMRQITDSMKIQITADTQSMELQLHPASLGNVQVNVASRGGTITANFITENETVKAALETQLVLLRDSFAEQGVKVEAIEVTVQSHAFEETLDQGKGNGSNQEAPRRNRTRRINLEDALAVKDLDEKDKIAAEMMAANGNVLDYTV